MVRAAAARVSDVVQKTPLIRCDALSLAAGADVYLKCECLQRTGSFKLRGATNALAALSAEQRAVGVVASSAGNHGLGLAYAAKKLGIRALVFVPSNAPAVKRRGIVALGAEVDAAQPDYDAAHEAALKYSRETGVTFVHPYAGAELLAGQATVALEILEELPTVKTIVVPVGGGGLVAGIGALVRAERPDVRVIGAQSDQTNAMALSLAAGRRVEVEVTPTIADGLSGQIDDFGFEQGRRTIDEMFVVSESKIRDAIAFLARTHELRVEGSGAVGVAAVFGGASHDRGPIAVVVSGGNIDNELWNSITA